MNKQDTLRNLLIAAAVFMLVMAIAPRLMPPPQVPPDPATAPVASAESPAIGTAATEPLAAAGPAEAYVALEADQSVQLELGEAPEFLKGQSPSPYRMQLSLSNVGASVSSVRLSDHAAVLRQPERYELLSPVVLDNGNVERSFTIEKINVNGHDVVLSDKRWHAEAIEPFAGDSTPAGPDARGQRAKFWIEIQIDGTPELRLTRTFELSQEPIGAGRLDVWSTLTVENLSAKPHRVIATYRGPLSVPGGKGYWAAEAVDFGVQNATGAVVGQRKSPAEVSKSVGRRLTLFRYAPDAPRDRFSWAAMDNTYFTATAAPLDAGGKSPATYIAEVAAVDLDGREDTHRDVAVMFVTSAQELPPGGSLAYHTELYLGEKDRNTFKTVEAYLSRNYYFQIAAGLSWCTFNWLVELMIWLLNHLYIVVRDFGIAIIILVLIVRAMLHPITKKGQVNMVRLQQKMADFAPKMDEVKKKYGNDKARLQQEMMKLYREQGINPAGQMLTCLPMVIQMPIWVALFYSLANNILMRHEPLHFTWIHDLTAPDALYTFASPIHVPIVGWEIASFNLLPILVAIFMYIQQKTIPKPEPNPNMSEQQRAQQEMMQKMMPMMSIMMLLIFYPMPAGLNLYVMFSSLFGWLEQNHIRKHIKAQKEAGVLEKPKGPPQGGPSNGKPRLPGWLEKLQKAAEDAQKAQRTQRRGKPKGKR